MLIVRYICEIFEPELKKPIHKDITVESRFYNPFYPEDEDYDDTDYSNEGYDIIKDWFCETSEFKKAVSKMNEYIDAMIDDGCGEFMIAIEFDFDFEEPDYAGMPIGVDYAKSCRAVVECKEDEFCKIFKDAGIPVTVVRSL